VTIKAPSEKRLIEIGGRSFELREVEESPCRHACPAGIDVKRYVGQIADSDFEAALATIRRHMPFPSACGRICPHPCETECARGKIDKPIAIMALKRFAIDYEFQKGNSEPLPAIAPSTGKKVAIIGSGPTGLTAAHDLALMGHSVTVFERSGKPGGMLTQAVPGFELPESAVSRDIDRIKNLGIKIEINHPINGTNGIEGLLKSGFDAVLLATGANGRWSGFKGEGWIEGLNLKGIQGAVEFTKSHRACKTEDIHENACRMTVLGYGVQALACARSCARLGGSEINWVIPFEKRDLQPDPRMIAQAEEEGVRIIERMRPVAILGVDGKVAGVRCVEVELSGPDHTGRRVWKTKPGSERVIECGSVIDAAYSAPDIDWAPLSTGPWRTIAVNPDTMATSRPGIFAAGDVASGWKSVVESVAAGHRSALGIHSYLNRDSKSIGTLSNPIRIHGWGIEDPARLPSRVFRLQTRPASSRVKDNDEAEIGFTSWEAVHEARRCLLCGPCEECAVCISACTRRKLVAQSEDGTDLIVRVPLDTARHLYESFEPERPGPGLLTAKVDPERCRACGICERICGYLAPRVGLRPDGKFASSIDIIACKGCGTCVAACPSGAIDQGFTSLHEVRRAIMGGKG
jgi:NADPH-dependent glutamate synthase beta subunit-like oxidoreductase/NAD-dependent dihydropyrimidine dehydrogenase PreA subunit